MCSSLTSDKIELPVRNRLRLDLLKNYDKIVHPVKDPTDHIKVIIKYLSIKLTTDARVKDE